MLQQRDNGGVSDGGRGRGLAGVGGGEVVVVVVGLFPSERDNKDRWKKRKKTPKQNEKIRIP